MITIMQSIFSKPIRGGYKTTLNWRPQARVPPTAITFRDDFHAKTASRQTSIPLVDHLDFVKEAADSYVIS
jgi:hypothetical protein